MTFYAKIRKNELFYSIKIARLIKLTNGFRIYPNSFTDFAPSELTINFIFIQSKFCKIFFLQ